MHEKKLALSTLARHVADELRGANSRAANDGNAIMQFIECEIEVGFEVELEASGHVNIWAVQLGADGSQKTSNTVRVKYQALPGTSTQASQST
jgi:hypothetical protein